MAFASEGLPGRRQGVGALDFVKDWGKCTDSQKAKHQGRCRISRTWPVALWEEEHVSTSTSLEALPPQIWTDPARLPLPPSLWGFHLELRAPKL